MVPFFAIAVKGEPGNVSAIYTGAREIAVLLNKHDGPFVLGKQLSIADLAVAPFLGRMLALAEAGLLPQGMTDRLSTDAELKPFWEYARVLVGRDSFRRTFDEQVVLDSLRGYIDAAKAAKV